MICFQVETHSIVFAAAAALCLQEMKCAKEKIPSHATPTGYTSFWLDGDTGRGIYWPLRQVPLSLSPPLAGYSGVGLLTKVTPLDVQFGIGIAEHDTEGRVITAEYDKFYLVVCYVPNSGRKLVRLGYRREFNRAFRAHLKKLDEKKPVIW